MNKKNTELMRGFVIGLSIVAVIAAVAAFFIKYKQTGETAFLPLAIVAMVLAASVLLIRGAKVKSGE